MRTLPSSDYDHITFQSLYTSPSGWITNHRGDIVCAMPFLPSFLGLFPVWLLLWRATGSRLFRSALVVIGRAWTLQVLGGFGWGTHTRGVLTLPSSPHPWHCRSCYHDGQWPPWSSTVVGSQKEMLQGAAGFGLWGPPH